MNNASRTRLSGGRLHTMTFAAVVLGLSADVGCSQDVSRYREFQLGASVASVVTLSETPGSERQDHPSAPRTAAEPRVEAVVFHERVDGAADRSGAARSDSVSTTIDSFGWLSSTTRSGRKA